MMTITKDSLRDDYVSNELIVRFTDDGIFGEKKEALLERWKFLAVKSEKPSRNRMLLAVDSNSNIDIPTFCEEVTGLSSVSYAEPNFIGQIDFIPDDPFFSEQWSYNITNAYSAWGGGKVMVAILDSGISLDGNGNLTHPDLLNPLTPSGYPEGSNDRFILGRNYVDPGSSVNDNEGHGTHVTGIVAANGNNDTGVAGLNWTCKVYIAKIAHGRHVPLSSYHEAVEDTVDYAVMRNLNVILNLSLGWHNLHHSITEACSYIDKFGMIQCVASGNQGWVGGLKFPAELTFKYPNSIIAVGNSEDNDEVHKCSNQGKNLTLVAPGTKIYSTVPTNIDSSGYMEKTGTSMAAPFVAGLASLVWEKYADYSNADVIKRIVQSCVKLGDRDFSEEYGNGRVDVGQALGDNFDTGFDTLACVTDSDNESLIYATRGDQYIVYSDNNASEIIYGYPKVLTKFLTSGDLPTEFQAGFDAMEQLQDNKLYIIKDQSYIICTVNTCKNFTLETPHPIKLERFLGLQKGFNLRFQQRVDSLVVLPNKSLYIFSGKDYIRVGYTESSNEFEITGESEKIEGNWGTLNDSFYEGFDAITSVPNTGKTYVLNGNNYATYHDEEATVVASGPKAMAGEWGDLPGMSSTTSREIKEKPELDPSNINQKDGCNGYVHNELIVKFTDEGVYSENKKALLERWKFLTIKHEKPSQCRMLLVCDLDAGIDIHTLCEEIAELSNVSHAELNLTGALGFIPNDPDFNKQWSYTVANACSAWGGGNVMVAILDTGIPLDTGGNLVHEDLMNPPTPSDAPEGSNDRFILGKNYVDENSSINDDSLNGQGTRIAGIIAANGNNMIGIAGLNWRCKIYIAKVADKYGVVMKEHYLQAVKDIIDYAVMRNLKVIFNCSFSWSNDVNDIIKNACDYIDKFGMIQCVASGGERHITGELKYPAEFADEYPESMIAVGSSEKDDTVAPHSAIGSNLTLVAPGEDIISTVPTNLDPSGYKRSSGTKLAAPFVAGLASLVWEKYADYSNSDVVKRIVQSCVKLGDDDFSDAYGNGRVDVGQALGNNFDTGFDTLACITDGNGDSLIYATKGDQYIVYSDDKASTLADGYPKALTQFLPLNSLHVDFRAKFQAGFDAMEQLQDGNLYIIKDEYYIMFTPIPSTSSFRLETHHPLKLDSFLGLQKGFSLRFQQRVDSLVVLPNKSLYIFSGKDYIRVGYTESSKKFEITGYSEKIEGNWGTLNDNFYKGFDAIASVKATGRTYVLKENYYATYDDPSATVVTNGPKPMIGKWGDLPGMGSESFPIAK